MKENNKKYSAIDFERYHSGAMLPDEMHALEKAALEDPFLADALEGYKNSKNAEKELNEIRMRLDEKRKRQKVFFLNSLSSGAWWKIAAMFILFAGIAYFFYATNAKKEASLAYKNNVIKKQDSLTISSRNADTIATEGDLAFEKPAPEKNENTTATSQTARKKAIEVSPRIKTFDRKPGTENEKKSLEKHLPEKTVSAIAMNNENVMPRGIIMNDSGKESFFRQSDTTARVSDSPAKYNISNEQAVAMNKKDATLNEVVVTGYGTRKMKSVTGAKLDGKVSAVNITSSSTYPKEGKEKFDQYIKDNALPVFDSTGTRIVSIIFLSFTLNKKHKPAHIKVLESSCEACEQEAIRLLKNGPPWIGKRGDSATVRIEF